MSRQYCFLCASDEGVFLDITVENKKIFYKQFEICSLVKVPTSNELPTKICHKCAYELQQCSTFLQKCKKSLKQKTLYRGKQCCSICHQQTKKEYTFDLSKEDSLQQTSIDKIQKIFNDEVDTFKGNKKFICLSCRYTVDVLCDLKNLSKEIASKLDSIINKEIDYSKFPQVKTAVINRKTTITESSRVTLKAVQDSDSDSETMTRTRSKNKVNNKLSNKVNAKTKEQVCKECESTIKNDSDAYKIEKTGYSVCKTCWENDHSNAKDAETSQNSAETKVCKVFLKDVLSQTPTKKGKVSKVEEGDQDGKKNRLTGKRGKKSPNVTSDTESDTGKQGEKRTLKTTNSEDTDSTDRPYKRLRRNVKDAIELEVPTKLESPPTLVSSRITRNRKTVENNKLKAKKSSESDSALNNMKERERPSTRLRKVKSSDNNDGSSTDDNASKKKKLKFSNDVTIMIDLTNTKDDDERPRRNVSTRNNASPEKVIKPALVKRTSQKLELSETVEKIISDDKLETHSCEECGVNYENKVAFLTHKLTHYKQPKLQLEKVTVESKVVMQSQTNEEVDDQCEDQSEAITIRVDDDEEETGMKENNMDVSNEEILTSRTEEKVDSPKEVLKEAADAEAVAKEVDNDLEQSIEKNSRASRSLSRRSKSSTSDTDKENVENIPEVTEEEAVEDISLTHIDDDQEEEDEEKEKEINKENEKETNKEDEEDEEEKGQNEKEDLKENEKEDEETEEMKKQSDKEKAESMEKENETTGKEMSIELKSSEDVGEDVADIDTSKSSEITDEIKDEEKDKLNSADRTEESEVDKKNDSEASEKSEEHEIETKERSSEELKEEETKEKSEKDKSSCSEESEDKDKSSCSEESEDKDKPSCSKIPEERDECDSSEKPEEDKPDTSKQSEETNKLDSSVKHDEGEITEEEEVEEIVEINSKCSSDDIKEVTRGGSDDEVEVQRTQKISDKSTESPKEIVILKNNKSTNDVQTSDSGVLEIDSTEPAKQSTDSADAAAEILQEVLDLASAEVQKRQDVVDAESDNDSGEAETLENISREVRNGGDTSRLLESSTFSAVKSL